MSDVVVHISNTDINSDYRIIREIKAITDFEVFAIGIEDISEPHKIDVNKFCKYITVKKLFIRFLGKNLNHFFNLLYFNIQVFCLLLKIKPSLIHVHDTYPLISSILYKLFSNCKVIYDCHELESDKAGQGLIFSNVTYLIEFLCFRFCDALITVSPCIDEWYKKNFKELQFHCLIYNSPEFKEVLEITKRIDNKNKFVYVGQFSDGRNLIEIIDLFIETKQEFHLMGWGELEGVINEYSKNYTNIHVHKPLPNSLLIEFLQVNGFTHGLCLIEPISLSDEFSLPNKLFEYTFCGLNVISSDLPEISTFVKNSNSGFIIRDLLHLKSLILADGLLPKELNKNYLKNYSWSNMIIRLRALYSNLL